MTEIAVSVALPGPIYAAAGAPSATPSGDGSLVGYFSATGDLTHGGMGSITGTVKEKSTPTNVPLRRRVRLHREVDGLALRETWSDAATGNYTFPDLNPTYTYYVVAFDYAQNYRAVIADNLTPEVA